MSPHTTRRVSHAEAQSPAEPAQLESQQKDRDPGRIRRAVVVRTLPQEPGMVRVVLAGEDMTDFTSTGVGDEYVRLFLPHPGQREVVMPHASGEYWAYPEGADPGPVRCYTVREVLEPGQVAIDFVIHDGGVAATWARGACPGDVVALNTPRGLYLPPDDLKWQLLLADATGLPALARIVEQTPPHVRTRVVVEVADPSHHPQLSSPGSLDVVQMVGGNGISPSGLLQALEAMTFPAGRGYIWFAGEAREQRAVRKHLRHTRGLPGSAYKVVGYWTERAEQWRSTWEGLDEGVRAQLTELWADRDRDAEAIADDVDALYENVGL